MQGLFDTLEMVDVPDSYLVAFANISNNVNFFFGLSETVAMTTGFFALWSAVKLVRIIIKIAPTIG